ncbi:hypothetical protein [Pseudomonas citronellolis]|uniref:hypothetical protein n=1 Tax=Pseudomonas citronellolis TaxID=53408 RepID=UPI0023E37116|nr:hypothetical protein [Pseudomonas citronellolis]MDF3935469.1 hypothetical protein [Pseudomonas citronellolis]
MERSIVAAALTDELVQRLSSIRSDAGYPMELRTVLRGRYSELPEGTPLPAACLYTFASEPLAGANAPAGAAKRQRTSQIDFWLENKPSEEELEHWLDRAEWSIARALVAPAFGRVSGARALTLGVSIPTPVNPPGEGGGASMSVQVSLSFIEKLS